MEELLKRLGIFVNRAPDEGAGGGADDKGDKGADDKGGDDKGGKKSAADIRAGITDSLAARRQAADDKSGDDKGDKGSKEDKGAKGDADDKTGRPANIPEKFWDAKTKSVNTEAMAKAYTTLEGAHAKLRTEKGITGEVPETPEGYFKDGFKPPEDLKNVREIPADDPAIRVWTQIAHKYKLPAELTTAIASEFLTGLDPLLPGAPDLDSMMTELGEGGQAIVDQTATWFEGLYDNGRLSEGELMRCYLLGRDPHGVRLLAKFRELAGEKPIPNIPASKDDLPSKEEFYAMNRDPRMKSEPAFREKVDRIAEQLFGTEPGEPDLRGIGMPPVPSRAEPKAKTK